MMEKNAGYKHPRGDRLPNRYKYPTLTKKIFCPQWIISKVQRSRILEKPLRLGICRNMGGLTGLGIINSDSSNNCGA